MITKSGGHIFKESRLAATERLDGVSPGIHRVNWLEVECEQADGFNAESSRITSAYITDIPAMVEAIASESDRSRFDELLREVCGHAIARAGE